MKLTFPFALPFIDTIKKYSIPKLKADLIAAFTVTIIALPQSMAYAVIAGVHPKYGLYAAIAPVIISSLLGSSRFLIAGPTNAISMMISSTMLSAVIGGVTANTLDEPQKMAVIFSLSLLTGLLQFAMGMVKVGSLVNFVSHSVVVGFTAGAGILIAVNQIKNLLGVKISGNGEFIETLHHTILAVPRLHVLSLFLGLFTIATIILIKKYYPKVPAALVAMLFSAGAVALFGLEQWGVKVVGDIPRSLPPLSMPSFSPELGRILFESAVALAVLATVEALSIAKSIASSSGEKIDANQELIAQGVANTVSAFTSAIPGTGSFTRSAINFKSGARTRFSGVFSGLMVLLIILALAPFARFIPIPSHAGIIIIIAYSMVDHHAVSLSYRSTVADRVVLLVTMFSTLLFHLETAVYLGIILSVALFLRKVSHPQVYPVAPREGDNHMVPFEPGHRCCPQIYVYQIEGSLFFGAIDELEDKLHTLQNSRNAKIFVLRMKGVRIADATAMHALEKFLANCKTKGVEVIITNVKPAVLETLTKSGLRNQIGDQNITIDTKTAIKLAVEKYADRAICTSCPFRVFAECPKLN